MESRLKRTSENPLSSQSKRPNTLSEFLLSLYRDPLTSANSIEGLYQSAIKNNRLNFVITREDVRQFLLSQPAYQQQQPVRRQLQQQKRTVVADRNLKWQMDLIDMRPYSSDNDGVQYLLTIVDVFSKYAFVFPLPNKKGEQVALVLLALFEQNMKPLVLLSDNGKEFLNKKVRQITDSFGVHHLTSYPYTPLGIIERFNKTIKSRIFAYMTINHRTRYIDVLDLLLQNYNKTRHSTIQEQPSYVHFCDNAQKECQVTRQQIHQRLRRIDEQVNAPARNQIEPFEIGNAVRVVAYLDPSMTRQEQFHAYKVFHKIRNPKWTTEIFFISDVFHDGYIIKYRVKDSDGLSPLRKYYHHQLQRVYEL